MAFIDGADLHMSAFGGFSQDIFEPAFVGDDLDDDTVSRNVVMSSSISPFLHRLGVHIMNFPQCHSRRHALQTSHNAPPVVVGKSAADEFHTGNVYTSPHKEGVRVFTSLGIEEDNGSDHEAR